MAADMGVRSIHVDPFSGASGDMLFGAVVDAGVELEAILSVLSGLGLRGYDVSAESVVRAGLGATRVRVRISDERQERTWATVRGLLTEADLPDGVRDRSLRTFSRLARAEARVHRVDVDGVRFHELGGVDAIVDIVGVCAGLALLGARRMTSGPVAHGVGTTSAGHGVIPVPAPAVLELLQGAPTYGTNVDAELCTPTGAALLAEFVDEWRPMPTVVVDRVGYGAGARELDRPNVLRLIVGEAQGAETAGPGADALLLLETTVDDLPGELVPPVLDALRAAGAADAWARPVVMKKGRPGLEIACLADPVLGERLRRLLFTETTTLGIRAFEIARWSLAREWVTVDVAGQPIRLKVARMDDTVVNVAPEFDDCALAATALGLPLKEVYALARALWPKDPSVPRSPESRPR